VTSLTRGRVIALTVACVTVVGVGILVAVFARSWWRGSGGTYAPRQVVAASTITPQSSLFADPLSAEVDVTVDPRRIDPASVQLTPSFAPFTVRSQSRRIDTGVGAAAIVRFRYAIECTVPACVPLMGKSSAAGAQTNSIVLPASKLGMRLRNGTTLAKSVAWPPITVHSRLTDEEVGFSTPRLPPSFTPPVVSWRLSPDLVGGLSLAVAVLLLLGAGALVASVAAGDTTVLRLRRPSRLSPVERALRLAEHAAASGEQEEERKALERLSAELERSGHAELANRARSLAWSEHEPEPEPEGLSSLAEMVRSNGGG
jgi:hypothetical protein